jgi:hypothetical protein
VFLLDLVESRDVLDHALVLDRGFLLRERSLDPHLLIPGNSTTRPRSASAPRTTFAAPLKKCNLAHRAHAP